MKKMKFISFILSVSGILFLLNSCSTASYKEIYPILADGKYDSEFPYKGASDELREISSTVQRIHSSVFYKTYTFDENANLTAENLKNTNLRSVSYFRRLR